MNFIIVGTVTSSFQSFRCVGIPSISPFSGNVINIYLPRYLRNLKTCLIHTYVLINTEYTMRKLFSYIIKKLHYKFKNPILLFEYKLLLLFLELHYHNLFTMVTFNYNRK